MYVFVILLLISAISFTIYLNVLSIFVSIIKHIKQVVADVVGVITMLTQKKCADGFVWKSFFCDIVEKVLEILIILMYC